MPVNRNHPEVPQPEDSNICVWRYMSLSKYISFLKTKSLYLPQLNRLRELDPYEGSTTKKEWEKIESGDKTAKHSHKYRIISLYTKYISCWHMNDFESEAMWKLYSNSPNEAVCIQTTYQKLGDALPEIQDPDNTHCYIKKIYYYIGIVKYIDHHIDDMPANNGLTAVMHKLKSFEHEREVRIIYHKYFPGTVQPELLDPDTYPLGLQVPIDINSTLESIRVSPTAKQWFWKMVKDVTQKYDVNVPVYQSSLVNPPYP